MALIDLRNALMAGKRLPYDAELEYLESTGTQWIDTGLPIAPNFYLDATFSIPSSTPHVLTFMGTTTQTQPYYRFWVCSIQTDKTINCGLINNALSTATLSADKPHDIYVKFFDGEQLCKLDGTTIVSAANTSNAAAKAAWLAQGNLLIGRSSLNKSFNFIGKTFAVKIYDVNGVLVRDFIPVRKGTVGYLYDRVSGRLFGNAGTGDFVLGPDVVPVEYIESHGAEWIDTGVPGRDGYDFEYRFRPIGPLPLGIGGEYENNQSCYIGLVRSNGKLAYNYSNPNVIVEVQSLTLGTDYDIKAHLYSGEQYFEVNGVRGGVGSRTGAFTSSYNLYLFAINSANRPTNLGVMRLYNFTAHLNTIPTRSFRPVRVGTEGAMMDTLTRRIYRNAGTGAFTFGNDLKYPIPAE